MMVNLPKPPKSPLFGSWTVTPRAASVAYGADRTMSSDRTEKSIKAYDDSPFPRVTWHSFVMGVFVSMGGFIFGYDTGQISGFLGMKNFQEQLGQRSPDGSGYFFSNVRSGLIVALRSVGTLMGALLGTPVADRIGRKWSISAWCIMLHIGLIVQISASQPKWYQIVVGRWIAGLGVGALSLLVPMYQGESAPRHIRAGQARGGAYLQQGGNKGISRQSSGSRWVGPSIPRGPPRKPKQSGHALWVGNLPPGTNVVDLKDHFSRDATEDIESVFLISKSNCAFVNYKSVSACTAAMGRFHDSRFQGVRLVCRFRRGAAAPAGAPTGPSASQPSTPAEPLKSPAAEEERPPKQEQLVDGVAPSTDDPQEPSPKVEEKYFIIESLTVEDLELSIRNGIWATQTHNETALNQAYESAGNVYLVFSVNKSGEYFGYARMTSSINDESAATTEFPSGIGTTANESDSPNTILTPATEFAPKGRVIDDSARGTIFWEADPTGPGDKLGEDFRSDRIVEEAEELTCPGNRILWQAIQG